MTIPRCDEDLGGTCLRQLLAYKPTAGPEAPAWLADGSAIVVRSPSSAGESIQSIDVKTGAARTLVSDLGERPFLSSALISVSPDGRWLAYVGEKGAEVGRERSSRVELRLVPLTGGAEIELTHLGANINAYSWSPDSSTIVFSSNRYGRYDLFKVSVPDGDIERLTADARYEVYPALMPDGESILYVRLNEHWTDHEIVFMTVAADRSRTVTTDLDFFDYHYGRRFGYPIYAQPSDCVIFPSHRSGWINYWRTPLAGGEATPICAQASDQTEAALSPDGSKLAFVSNHDGTLSLFISPVDGTSSATATPLVAPEMGVISAPAWSPDGSHIAYLAANPTSPADLWVVDVAGGTSRQLTSPPETPSLARGLQTPEKVHYASADGFTISAYLYTPPNREAGVRYPGLIIAHGGPTMQFFDTYHADVQYFVRKGYVVLMPNIRGSSGYGKSFEDANNADWGHGDLRDVLAGVEYLRTLDYVDGENMGIHGMSYGGCMSMNAVAFAPGVFNASVPHAGYGDWLGFEEGQELRHRQLMRYEFGDIDENRDVYVRCSPIYSLADATTPVFLVHGEGRFPRSDASLKFARALEQDYKVFEYKVYPNECYYVISDENLCEMLPDIVDFLDRYLRKPGSP
ncbi:MAG: S9 family peptidase [Caldilineaceae bacterium]